MAASRSSPEPAAAQRSGRRSFVGLSADGAAVLVHSWAAADGDRADPGGAEQLVADLRADGARLEHVSADLADPATPARLIAMPHDSPSVGSTSSSPTMPAPSGKSLEELTAAEIDFTYSVNARHLAARAGLR